uniref:Uncharacterized protein n=1 Tax=Timema poppense TaxID=170557 RepID=A0A7R9D5Q4_TIMPO|nr:unnamed protein product [Timema poppensis]
MNTGIKHKTFGLVRFRFPCPRSLLTELDQDPDFVHLKNSLLDHGVDVQDIYTLYEQLLGFKMFTALRPLEGSTPKGARTEL